MIEFFSPISTSCRFHCPMHGPQAFASTTPPTFVKIFSCPSRLIVARICSLPGVIVNSDFVFSPTLSACFATDVARSISS